MWNNCKHWLDSLGRKAPEAQIAVFVDCDGVSANDAQRALDAVKLYGRIRLLRAYGNHDGRAAGAWASLLDRYNGEARHLPTLRPGKNANDIALSIDAVEVLLTNRVDVFVLIVNDTDFVPLARRILQDGKTVLGFGRGSTSLAFREACTKFWNLTSLSPQPDIEVPRRKLWVLSPADAEQQVLRALKELAPDGSLIALNGLSKVLKRTDPGFDPRLYSRRNISSLLRELPTVEVVDLDGTLHARLREPPG
ncbi:MAG: NYN domain-containing protein [Devosia sp.]